MKRRGFLGLLGLAPAAPLIAKELAKGSASAAAPESSVQYATVDPSEMTSVCMCTLGPTVSVPRKWYRALDPGWSK